MGLIAEANTLGRSIIIVDAVDATLASFAVALRLWSRQIRKNPLDSADYTVLLALVRSACFRQDNRRKVLYQKIF